MRIRYYCGFDAEGKWHAVPETEATIKLYRSQEEAKRAHAVIPDEMEPLVHPCDGQVYTSKAKFRETTRAYGKEEVGNDYEAIVKSKPEDARPQMTESLRAATEMLSAIEGKSESERREIQKRFYGDKYEVFREELEIEALSRSRSERLEAKDRYLERYGER